MQKQNVVIISCLVLFLAVTTFLYLSEGRIAERKAQENATIEFYSGDVMIETDISFLRSLESETFKAVIRSSSNKPQEVEYTGVLFSVLLEALDLSTKDKKQAAVRGADGYVAIVALDEIKRESNIYLAYAMNGKDMKPARQGGYGPFQLIIRTDPYSQRWCKYVCRVELQ